MNTVPLPPPADGAGRTGGARVGPLLWALLALLVLAALFILPCRVGGGDDAPPGAAPGDPAPDFALPRLDGGTLRLSDLKGKTVLLDFWATWCGPCRQAMRETLAPLAAAVGDSDRVAIVSIGAPWQGESAETQRAFVEKQGYAWTFVHDADGAAFDRYGVQAIPTLVLIGPDGAILDRGLPPAEERLADALRAAAGR